MLHFIWVFTVCKSTHLVVSIIQRDNVFMDFSFWFDTTNLDWFYQGLHRLEKYLNLESFLEKSLKIKSALKSTGKSPQSLEKSSTFCCISLESAMFANEKNNLQGLTLEILICDSLICTGLEVIKLEFILKLKIKRNKADMPIIALYFIVLKFFNLEAMFIVSRIH